MFRIHSEEIPYQANSELLFGCLRDLPDAIWLDSGKPRSLQGRFDIISACPQSLIETTDNQTFVISKDISTESDQGAFATARALLSEIQPIEVISETPFTAGLIGYFGYDLERDCAPTALQNPAATQLPDMRLGLFLWSLIIDHELRKTTLYFHESCQNDLIDKVRQRLSNTAESIAPQCEKFQLQSTFTPTVTKDRNTQDIGHIKQYITEGDCYQVNYAQHHWAEF